MDSLHGRVRSGAAPVILCVLGAVCSFTQASADAQQSAGPGNDKDIDFTPQPGLVWSCTTAHGCKSSPNIYTENDTAAWELKATDYAESCDTFDYDYDTAFPDGFYAAVRSQQFVCNACQFSSLVVHSAVRLARAVGRCIIFFVNSVRTHR